MLNNEVEKTIRVISVYQCLKKFQIPKHKYQNQKPETSNFSTNNKSVSKKITNIKTHPLFKPSPLERVWVRLPKTQNF